MKVETPSNIRVLTTVVVRDGAQAGSRFKVSRLNQGYVRRVFGFFLLGTRATLPPGDVFELWPECPPPLHAPTKHAVPPQVSHNSARPTRQETSVSLRPPHHGDADNHKHDYIAPERVVKIACHAVT